MNKNYSEKFTKMKVAGKLAAQTLDMITDHVKQGISNGFTASMQAIITNSITNWLEQPVRFEMAMMEMELQESQEEENGVGEGDCAWSYSSDDLSSNGEYVFTIENESGSMDFDVIIDVKY